MTGPIGPRNLTHLRYNDRNVNENHHVAAAFEVCLAAFIDPRARLRLPAAGFYEAGSTKDGTLCYAIVLPGRRSGFRAGFRPD